MIVHNRAIALAIALGTVCSPGMAFAEPADAELLMTGSASGAAPLNRPQQEALGVGAVGSLGVYLPLQKKLQIGANVNAGGFAEDESSTAPDAGHYGFGLLNAAVRYYPFASEIGDGFWVEGAGGPAIVSNDVLPVVAPSLGYSFQVGDIGLGPTARYLHAFEDERFDGENTQIATLGLEVDFGIDTDRRREPRRVEVTAARTVPSIRAKVEIVDEDGDGVADQNDDCPDAAEVYNGINDHDGCPDTEVVVFVRDRLVIDEKVFFDYDEAELRPEGKRLLDQIAAIHRDQGGDWEALRISGYADRRGPKAYNLDLSARRAEAVADYLKNQGVPQSALKLRAYGESDPAVPNAETPREFQQNRRVDFRIIRQQQ